MPSIGTSILSARVKDETLAKFKNTAEEYHTTVPKILDSIAGVTKEASGALAAFSTLETSDDSWEISDLELEGADLIDLMIDYGYPEVEIRKWLRAVKNQLTPYQKSE